MHSWLPWVGGKDRQRPKQWNWQAVTTERRSPVILVEDHCADQLGRDRSKVILFRSKWLILGDASFRGQMTAFSNSPDQHNSSMSAACCNMAGPVALSSHASSGNPSNSRFPSHVTQIGCLPVRNARNTSARKSWPLISRAWVRQHGHYRHRETWTQVTQSQWI